MSEIKKKIKLEFPVKLLQEDGSFKIYEEVEIGRLKNKHLKQLPKDFMDNDGKISPGELSGVIAALADIPIEVAEEIDLEDSRRISKAMESFFDSSQVETGRS